VISAKSRGAAVGGSSIGGLLGSTTPLSNKLSVVGEVGCQRTHGGVGVGPIMNCVAGVSDGEYYRLFTAMFMHYGLLHIALNMWALWAFGRTLEQALGPIRFLSLYLLSGLGGSVAAYWFGDQHNLTAGASGAIFGLFAALFILLKRVGRDTSVFIPIIVLNVALNVIGRDVLSIAGHVGGLVTGAIVAFGLAYAPQKNRNMIQTAVMVAVGVALVLLTAVQTASINAVAL